MPEDARRLIEGVYGDSALDNIPEALEEKTYGAEGDDKARSALAELNVLKLELDYTGINENQWWDDALTPTHLGELTTTIKIKLTQLVIVHAWVWPATIYRVYALCNIESF